MSFLNIVRIMKSCIVTAEAIGPFNNGGIGTHCTNLAKFLAREMGREVTLLYVGEIEVEDVKFWKKAYRERYGVVFEWIDPAESKTAAFSTVGTRVLDDLLSQAVMEYLTANPFGIVYFQDLFGLGYRSIQAKRTGVGFSESLLTCTMHSSTNWVGKVMKMPHRYGISQMLTMAMERYCAKHCDVVISPSRYMLDWTEREVGELPERQQVVPYLIDEGIVPVETKKAAGKLIFFGRLEQRKGLMLFLDTLRLLKGRYERKGEEMNLEVHLLGKQGYTFEGGSLVSIARFREAFRGKVAFKVVDDLGHDEAIAYLREHNDAVVVCPSVEDNLPNAIIEALVLGVNLVSCKTGGIPELFADEERLVSRSMGICVRFCGKG